MFRNETKEWYHVHVNGEEIVCTGGHPFYVANLDKFIPAKDLKIGESLLLSDGSCAIIEEIQVEQLETPETKYNFEVEDFHTYYVSNGRVSVHNECQGKDIVGTNHDDFKPTQDEIRIRDVNRYVNDIKAGKPLKPIQVYEVPGQGTFIADGHHRYVASKLMGIEPNIVYLPKGGPVGLPDWSSVRYVAEFTPW